MLKIERSLNIALAPAAEDQSPREVVVTPITASESLVAFRGLSQHLDYLYSGVSKKANSDRALLAIYDFIGDNVERYRQNAANLTHTLDLTREEYSKSRVPVAMAVSYLLVGAHSHKAGVWLKGKAGKARLHGTYEGLMDYDNVEFYKQAQWARQRAAGNSIFWRQQLEGVRDNEYVLQLKEAIEESVHHEVEV